MRRQSKNKILKGSKRKPLIGIDLLMTPAYKNQYKNLAETVSQRKLDFNMVKGAGCHVGFKENKPLPIMNIDLQMFENQTFSTSHYHVIAKGAIYHECGHLLFTDYDILKQNAETIKTLTKEMKDIATEYHNADDSDKPQIETQLADKVKEYVLSANMPRTLNSFEDASIERSMCEYGTEENGCITFLRTSVYEKELTNKREELKNNTVPLNENEWDDNTFEKCLTEARHLATMPYQNTDTTVLEELFDDKELEEIKSLCLYARFQAIETADRNVVARTFLNMCEPILQNISNKLLEAYINNLNKAEDMVDEMNNAAQNATQQGGNTLPGQNGAPSSQPQQQSKYNLPMPDDIKNKMQQAMNQLQQNNQSNGNESGNTEEDGTEQANNQNQSGEGESTQDDSSQEDTFTGGDSVKEDDQNNDDTENQEGSPSGSGDSDEEKQLPSPKEMTDDAVNAMNQAIHNATKSFVKQQQNDEVNTILNHPDVRSGESACHHNYKLCLDDFVDSIVSLGNYSHEGSAAKATIEEGNMIGITNDLTRKIKKVLMRRSLDSISHGRREGKVDCSSLYRVNTDLQVFRKDVQGEKKKIRFAILVDESGSMSGPGLKNAIIGCWMIASAAKKLKIPYAVYGHKDMDVVHVEKYIDYNQCFKQNILDNLFYMESNGCNRDGLAMYHVLRELCKSAKPDEELYFIILSDGQPSSEDYYGYEAIEDMRNIMKTFEVNWNVKSIGIGLGDDFDYQDTVGQIYENAVVVKDAKELPNEMFKVFKKMLRV